MLLMTWKRLVNCDETELAKSKLVYIVAGGETIGTKDFRRS